MLANLRGNSHAIRMGTICYQTFSFLSTFVLVEERGFFLPVWRSLLLFIIIFESITIPLRLAFAVSSQLFLFWVELSIDVLFLFDILINFCITYRTKSGQLVKDRWRIARRYLLVSFPPGSNVFLLTFSNRVGLQSTCCLLFLWRSYPCCLDNSPSRQVVLP